MAAAATVKIDADKKATDIAVPDRGVEARGSNDAVGECSRARRESTDLEIVAIDRDVVGGDGDGLAAGDGGGQVLFETPRALGADRRRQRRDETGAVVVAFG